MITSKERVLLSRLEERTCMGAAKSIQESLVSGFQLLESSQVPSPRLEAEILLAHVLGVERLNLYMHPGMPLEPHHWAGYQSLIEKRRLGVPTAYLRRKKEFYSLTFEVGPGV